jgi:flagellin-like protein
LEEASGNRGHRALKTNAISINNLEAEERLLYMPTGSRLQRRGVSEIIAVLLMVLITLAAGFIIFIYVSGLFGTLTRSGPSNEVTVNGEMTVPGTYDASGILSLTVRNGGSTVINGATVTCPTTYFSSANCNSFSINFNGAQVLPGNPLSLGATAAGSGTVTACVGGPPGCLANSFTSGTSYELLVIITFGSGSIEDVPVAVTSTG